MNLALIYNASQADRVASEIRKQRDDIDITIFSDVHSFMDNCITRRLTFHRVLLHSRTLTGDKTGDMVKLHNFLKGRPNTTLVIVNRATENQDLVKFIYSTTYTPSYCVININTLSSAQLVSFVTENIEVLNDKYGTKDSLQLSVDVEEIGRQERLEEEARQEEERKNSKPTGILGGIMSAFGLGGLKTQKTGSTSQNEGKVQKPENTDSSEVTLETDVVQEKTPPLPSQTVVQAQVEYHNRINSMRQENQNQDLEEDVWNVVNDDGSSRENIQENENSGSTSGVEVENEGSERGNSLGLFGSDLFILSDDTSDNIKGTEQALHVETSVTDDLFVGEDELRYREEHRRKNTIEREVVITKEGKHSQIEALLKGSLKRVIVCTGDRGSGVTGTALRLARKFAQTVPVLYIDCDIDNHGLLNYVDYDSIVSFGEPAMNGIGITKNMQSFHNCVVRYSDNLDILTSVFGSKATMENLEGIADILEDMLSEYNIIVVDVNSSYVRAFENILRGNSFIYCVRADKVGYMNAISAYTRIGFSRNTDKYVVSNGALLVTGIQQGYTHDKMLDHVQNYIELPHGSIFSMNIVREQIDSRGMFDNKLLSDLLG